VGRLRPRGFWQPPRPRPSRATPMAAWQVLQRAPCNHRPRYRLANAARARASRRRAPRAAAHERLGIDYGLCYGLALVRSGAHMQLSLLVWRLVRGLDSIIVQYSPLRGYSTHTHWCSALVRHGSAGLVVAHQCRQSGNALLRSKPRKARHRATMRVRRRPRHRRCGLQRPVENKQTNKQTK
jgi:hypothetical protein